MSTLYPVATAASKELVVATPDPGFGFEAQERSPRLNAIWQHILRWKWVIVGIVLVALIGGLVVTSLTPKRYTATTRIDLSRNTERASEAKDAERGSVVLNAEFYQTQYSLLHARSLATRVANALNLARSRTYAAAIGQRMSGPSRHAPTRTIVSALLDATAIRPIPGSSLVDIQVETRDAGLSAQIANEWAAQYIQASLEKRFQSTASARRFLETRLSELRQRMDESDRELVTYSADAGVIALSQPGSSDGTARTQPTLVGQNLIALDAALSNATAERIAAESRVSKSGALSLQASQSLLGLRQQRAEVAVNYARLITQFEPGYPAAQALQSQLNTLDQTISREEGRVRESLNNEFRQAVRRESDLRAQVEVLKNRVVAEQRGAIRSNVLQRDVDTNRQLYDALLQRYKEIGVQGVTASNISIVDAAEVPVTASNPKLLNNLALALLLGIVLAVAATIALVQIDEGIDSPAAVRQHLPYPLLGVIPAVSGPDARTEFDNQHSAVSNAYAELLGTLAFSTHHGVPRTIAVTSTRAGEGKSATSYALAKMLVRSGRRVLLIDGDMQSPSLHLLFGIENTEGFSNLLAGADDWQRMVRAGGMDGLSFLTAGPYPPSAAELLSGPRLASMIETFATLYDHVLIDCRPALGTADGPLIAATVQGVIYIVQANGSRLRRIRMGQSRLKAGHGHILGVLLTKYKAGAFDGQVYGNPHQHPGTTRLGSRLLGRA